MIAAVTGATSGFGLAICRRFVADGGRVIAMGRRLERLVALREELGAAKCFIIQIDVRDRAATESWVSSLPDEFSAVDVLVNNAGLALGLESAHEANLDDWTVRAKSMHAAWMKPYYIYILTPSSALFAHVPSRR